MANKNKAKRDVFKLLKPTLRPTTYLTNWKLNSTNIKAKFYVMDDLSGEHIKLSVYLIITELSSLNY